MSCPICRDLERAFEATHSEYIEARHGAYYRVSMKFAAYKNVDMERARNELEEHRMACASAVKETALIPVAALLRLAREEGLWGDPGRNLRRTV
jgi:hypothetical protein